MKYSYESLRRINRESICLENRAGIKKELDNVELKIKQRKQLDIEIDRDIKNLETWVKEIKND